MNAYVRLWQALTRSQKTLSLLLMLMPIGIIFGRTLAMVTVFIFAGIALYHFATRKITWRQLDPVAKAALALGLILLLIATPFASESVLRSFKISLLFLCFPLFYITVTMVCTQARALFYPALAAVWLLLPVMVIDGIAQRVIGVNISGQWLINSNGRVTSLLNHPNFTATIGTFLFVLLAWYMPRINKTSICLVCGLIFVTAIASILSGDRSATLLLLAALLTGAGLLALHHPRARVTIGIMTGTLIATTVTAFLMFSYLQERAFHFWEQLINFHYSLYGQLYQAALFLWLSSPLTGIGASNFRLACPSVGARYYFDCNLHPHNYVLEFLSEGGVFACIVWGMVIVGFFRLCVETYRRGSMYRILAIVGVMIGIVHLFPFIGTQSIFSTWRGSLLWFALSMWVAARNECSLNAKQ